MSTIVETHDDHGHHGPAKGLTRWLFTTNHKDIGTLYLWFSFLMLFIGGTMAMVIRAELFEPGLQIVQPEFFNQMTTNHGLIMVFGVIMPAFVGLANWMIPMQIGAPDMALPRLNNLSFLVIANGFWNTDFNTIHGCWRAKFWMDLLCTTFYNLCTRHSYFLYFFRSHNGGFFHSGFN